MWKTLTSYEHKLSVSVGSSGHHVPVVANIVADLHRIAELNLQNAANIGFTRALEDMKERGWIIKYDMPVVAPRFIVDDSIKENRKYLEQSLLPDLKRDLDQCKTADDVPRVIAKYRSRIFLYGHWSWRTAERAYRDGMKSFVAFTDRNHNVREVGTAASGDRGHKGRKGVVGGSTPSNKPIANGANLQDVLQNMGAFELNTGPEDRPELYMTHPKSGFTVRNPDVTEPRIVANFNGQPRVVDTVPNARLGVGTINTNERPPDYLFRAVSEADYQQMKSTGRIQSDGRMNLSSSEGTVAAFTDPSFYLPGHLASNKAGEYEARIIRIKYSDDDKWRLDKIDGYAKTNSAIPFSRVDMVSPKIVITRDERGHTETTLRESLREVGTAASGDRGHVGRKGHVGGSGPGSSVKTTPKERATAIKQYMVDTHDNIRRSEDRPENTPLDVNDKTTSEYKAAEEWAQKIEAHDPTTVQNTVNGTQSTFKDGGTVNLAVRDSVILWAIKQQPYEARTKLANDVGMFSEHAKELNLPIFDERFVSPRSRAVIERELNASNKMPESLSMFVSIKDDPQAGDHNQAKEAHTFAYVRGGQYDNTLAINTNPKIWIDTEHAKTFDPKTSSMPFSTYEYMRPGVRQEAILTHEMGHVLENTLSTADKVKFNTVARNVVEFEHSRGGYKYTGTASDNPRLSTYGLENNHELFAENYAAYRYGLTDKMSPKMVSYFKDVIHAQPIDPALREAESKDAVQVFGTLKPMHADYTCNLISDSVAHYELREALVEGGPGSGDRGHKGRKGIVGGSGAAETPVAHVQTAANEIGVDPNGPAPWDLKAPAPPRYPGDNSIYSPAIPDAHGNFVLGRRIQGLKLDPPNDPNQVAMYTFIPDSVTQDQLAKYEGAIKANTDHAQTHPGFIAYVDSKGELQRTQGNNYWIRADYRNLNKLSDELTPKLTEQFGKNTFTTMMTNVTPGGTQITKGDALEHMRVVVPFAEGTPKNTVGESSLDRATRDKILTAMSGSEGRHVWEHADFNGIHIAVSTTPSVVDKLFPVVTALGGLRDKEEETHHNAGATRFIPTKINLERYPVRGYKESFVEADDSQGVLLYFIGPDDSETCDGCAGAVDGNPYTVDDAPEPGEFECMARCRHMLQADGDLGDDTTSYEWSGSIGFGETTDQPDNQDAIDLAAIALQSNIDLDTYFAKVADDMQTLSYSADVLDKIDIKNLDDQELLEFVSVMTDNGIALDDLDQLMDLSDAEIAKLRGAFRDIATDVSEDDITYLLNNGDVDILQQYIKDIGGQVLETLVDMGAEGFDDIDAIQAETLAQVLNKVATLDQDGRWYVL